MASRLGGRQQRAARASGSASSGVGERADIVAMAVHGSPMWRESEQAQALLYKWAWGHMAATEVQATAKRQYADELAALRRAGVANPEAFATPAMKTLMEMGASGRHARNVNRALLRLMGQDRLLGPTKVLVSARGRCCRWTQRAETMPTASARHRRAAAFRPSPRPSDPEGGSDGEAEEAGSAKSF